jgi:cytokinin dehydrogenase
LGKRTAPLDDDATVRKMLDDNRRFFEKNRDIGGTRYPVDAIKFSRSDWKQQFRSVWDKLVSAKRRYDPHNLRHCG